jgi:hypothetical protein
VHRCPTFSGQALSANRVTDETGQRSIGQRCNPALSMDELMVNDMDIRKYRPITSRPAIKTTNGR